MKYRKKPVVIEAYQFNNSNLKECPEWLNKAFKDGVISIELSTIESKDIIKIKTLEGVMEANKGWWIIKGVKGELYACEPKIFELTYEKVEE